MEELYKNATVEIHSPSFGFKYLFDGKGSGYAGGAAVAEVTVSCGAGPPPPAHPAAVPASDATEVK